MAWYPPAVKRPVARSKRRMATPRRINLHTAVSDSKSMFGFFSGRGVFSHFYVREDGTVEQYQDTALRAACDLDGNPDTISVESWDGYGRVWRSGNPPAWTPLQVSALVKLIAWVLHTHPTIPQKLATSNRKTRESHGVSFHRLGVPGYMSYARPYGLQYSSSRGKICPGPARIAQIPAIFHAATNAQTPSKPATPGLPPSGAEGPPQKPAPIPVPPTPTGGLSMADIDTIMARLNNKQTGLPYLSEQIKVTAQSLYDTTKGLAAQNAAIANGAFGRAALNARNADVAAIVQKVVTAAMATVPGVDMDRMAATVSAATKAALDERDASDADAVIAKIVDRLEATK